MELWQTSYKLESCQISLTWSISEEFKEKPIFNLLLKECETKVEMRESKEDALIIGRLI